MKYMKMKILIYDHWRFRVNLNWFLKRQRWKPNLLKFTIFLCCNFSVCMIFDVVFPPVQVLVLWLLTPCLSNQRMIKLSSWKINGNKWHTTSKLIESEWQKLYRKWYSFVIKEWQMTHWFILLKKILSRTRKRVQYYNVNELTNLSTFKWCTWYRHREFCCYGRSDRVLPALYNISQLLFIMY